jgi:hypothetical protein
VTVTVTVTVLVSKRDEGPTNDIAPPARSADRAMRETEARRRQGIVTSFSKGMQFSA